MKRLICFILFISFVLCAASGLSEAVVRQRYVFLDWAGEYTGQADSNGIPFGFGVFIAETLLDGESWHYIGQWEDGLPEGEGALYFDNGNIQKGVFCKGVLTDGFSYQVSGISVTPVQEQSEELNDSDAAYIGNKKSMRFHLPTCRAVRQMNEKNKVELSSREEAIERHYIPCGECNP